MNQLDNYLICLDEGELWDKTKAFAKKHKNKLKIAAGVAGAVAAGYAAKKGHDKYKEGEPERLAAKKVEAQKKRAAEDKIIAKSNSRKKSKGAPILVPAVKAIGKTAEIATRPVRWVGKKAGSLAAKGVKAAGTGAKNLAVNTVKNTINDTRANIIKQRRIKQGLNNLRKRREAKQREKIA